MKKRIIACSDGTWNKPGGLDRGKPVKTNVELMYESICKDGNGVKQLKLYDSGVGTGYTAKDKFLGATEGFGIDQKIQDIYKFLILTYEEEDEIFLFGFSRGGYTARSVVGMINCCGILKPEYLHLINEAYYLYRNKNIYTHPESDLMVGFKNQYSRQPKIKFLGVWDTVGSLGVPLRISKIQNKNKYQFHDVKVSKIVEHAYHALAIHDLRFPFTPTFMEKGDSAKTGQVKQTIEQRWFSGVHANVGGGYSDRGLSDLPLQWLMKKATELCLCYDEEQLKQMKPDPKGELRNSYTPLYWGWLPKWRTIYGENQVNEVLDKSVIERYDKKYMPKVVKKAIEKGIPIN